MGGSEIRVDSSDAKRRVTRRDVCLACDQCIKRPAMPLTCTLIVNPDRDFQPCAAKLARMQAHPHAQCPHPDSAQRAKWEHAALHFLGQPINTNSVVIPGQVPPAGTSSPRHRGRQHATPIPIFVRRASTSNLRSYPRTRS
jgi:hypothetical protein